MIICMHMGCCNFRQESVTGATICLFSKDDEDMIKNLKLEIGLLATPAKVPSNNSAMLLRDETTFEEFQKIMESVQHSGGLNLIWWFKL